MRYLALFFGVLLVVGVIWLATRKPLSIADELAKLTPTDRQALEAVLGESGVPVTALQPVLPGVLQYHPRAVAVQDGRVVELRISDAPLRHLDALATLTGLRALWLSGNQLTAVPGLGSLTALKRLNLSNNQLTSLVGMAALPALVELDVSDNRITDLAPLTALPALTTIVAMHNPLASLPSPQPAQWKVKSDAVAAAPTATAAAAATAAPSADRGNRPANWVQNTPPTSGAVKQGSVDGLVQADAYSVTGTLGTLHGAFRVSNIPGAKNAGGAGTTLELSVTKGRVRAYLQYVPPSDSFAKLMDGYVFVDAEPGKPGKLQGVLQTVGAGYGFAKAYNFVIESLDGDAQGISYRLYR